MTIPSLPTKRKEGAGTGLTRGNFNRFLLAAAVITLAFLPWLWELAVFSYGHDLYSYIPLIPMISGWLIWTGRDTLPPAFPSPFQVLFWASSATAIVSLYAGRSVLAGLHKTDALSIVSATYIALIVVGVYSLLGRNILRSVAFPAAFLVFAIPLPEVARSTIEHVLQYASAEAAELFFLLSTTTYLREGLVFFLPGMTIQVAPECSGIHSSLVLLITSVLAGKLFLRSPLNRIWLSLAVIPLAILRNGFRILVVGELCVQIGPQMINSYIHRHGGPIFFGLSLVPFVFLLGWLRRRDPKS